VGQKRLLAGEAVEKRTRAKHLLADRRIMFISVEKPVFQVKRIRLLINFQRKIKIEDDVFAFFQRPAFLFSVGIFGWVYLQHLR